MRDDIKIIQTSESWMFRSSKKQLVYELVEDFLLFCFTYTIIATIVAISIDQYHGIYRGMFLLPIVLAITFIRWKVRYLSLFTLSHLFVAAVCLGITYIPGFTVVERVFYTIYVIVWIIFSYKAKYKEYTTFFNIKTLFAGEVVLALCYIAASITDKEYLGTYVTVMAVILLITSLIYIYIIRTQNLMEWEVKYASRFADRIKRLKVTSSFFIGSSLMILLAFVWGSGLLSIIDRFQRSFISSFSFLFPENGLSGDVNWGAPPPVDFQPDALGEVKEPNPILEILAQVIIWLLVAVVIFLLIVGLFVFLKHLYNDFYRKRNSSEEREIIIPDDDIKSSYVKGVQSLKRKVLDLLDGTNRKKIRTIYSKAMIKYKKKGVEVLQTNTPFELQENIKEKKGDDVQEITSIYKKARYSTIECTDSDVNRMLEHYKKL